MGKVIRFPKRHARASSASAAIRKSSIRTSPPVASLNRLASFIETPRSPFKISDKCGSEQPESAASFAWLISLCPSIQTASGCFVSMTATLLLAKFICQALLCSGEMDMHSLGADALLMAKTAAKPRGKPRKRPAPKPVYVGPWIRAHNTTPAEVSRATGINEGYLSTLCSGKKGNPSNGLLALIADHLKMPLGDLFKPPPPRSLLDQIADFDPEVIVRLSKKRRNPE
jgi:hypothetical protein